jgi:hypothetical protein
VSKPNPLATVIYNAFDSWGPPTGLASGDRQELADHIASVIQSRVLVRTQDGYGEIMRMHDELVTLLDDVRTWTPVQRGSPASQKLACREALVLDVG